ncbi:DUF6086 family protein [Streptomyces sp. NPDC002055]|uniref:DUF6086 family protein n=1 Tax=Streptomyces sp. NPDC002055 TaxID=3154534 RepID=UPI00331BB01A
MSQYYGVGDRTLWNPSNGASRLFMMQVGIHQAELGLPSGIGPVQDDECEIDPAVFEVFVAALLAWHRKNSHAVMAALSEGFVATVLVLAERAGIALNWPCADLAKCGGLNQVQPSRAPGSSDGSWAVSLQEKSHELGRLMAT